MMAEPAKPLLIKRYASRRLYNTETSDYVTLEDIAGFVRAGRDVQIVDLKTGDDLTRQYLLQIVAEHESKGDSVLPTNVLTDLVRSYATNMQSVMPQFLAASFDMLRDGQSKMLEGFAGIAPPMAGMPGFEAMRKQQEAFMKTMLAGMPGWGGTAPARTEAEPAKEAPEDLAEIRSWLERRVALLAARDVDDILRAIDHMNFTTQWAQSKASDDALEAVTDPLLMAMHDLRSVLIRKKADRLMKDEAAE